MLDVVVFGATVMRPSPAAAVSPVDLPEAPPSLDAFLAVVGPPAPVLPVAMILLALLYLAGAARMWSARRKWPVWRALCFLAGCALVAAVTGLGIEAYGYGMLSVFMFQQLTLMMAAPPLLVLGSPGTLLLRATPHSGFGRVVLVVALGALRSRAAGVALHPGFTIPLFLASFYGLYLSGAADSLLRTTGGHVALEVLFLAAGVLFTVPLISRDPLPVRPTHVGRLLDLFVEMPLHAFFGVFLMMASFVTVPYFASPPAAWGLDPLGDQALAGGLAWSYGEGPSLILVLIMLVRWQRDDTRRAAARDRRVDRDGDAELDAYNDYLSRLGAREQRDV